jgi:hypothetical protein
MTAEKTPLSSELYQKYQNIFLNRDTHSHFTFYPDQSRSIDDIVSVIGMMTTKGSPLLSIIDFKIVSRS